MGQYVGGHITTHFVQVSSNRFRHDGLNVFRDLVLTECDQNICNERAYPVFQSGLILDNYVCNSVIIDGLSPRSLRMESHHATDRYKFAAVRCLAKNHWKLLERLQLEFVESQRVIRCIESDDDISACCFGISRDDTLRLENTKLQVVIVRYLSAGKEIIRVMDFITVWRAIIISISFATSSFCREGQELVVKSNYHQRWEFDVGRQRYHSFLVR